MDFYKVVYNGYILGVGAGKGGTEITEDEYNNILSILKNVPTESGKSYKLKEDLTWEEVESDTEIDDTEAFDIIFGGAE